jgi:hypothetical protein
MVEEPLLVDKNRYIDTGDFWYKRWSYGVELGTAQELTKMKVYGNLSVSVTPTGWTPNANDFEVYSSINGVDWSLVQTVSEPFLHQQASGQWGFSLSLSTSGAPTSGATCGEPVSASWIKIRYNDSNSIASLEPGALGMRVGEIELFGINSSSSASSSSTSSSSLSSSSLSSSSLSSSSESL